MLRTVHEVHMRKFTCTHEKCFISTSNIQYVTIHFIMLHDNISWTHGKYDWNTWTIFHVTWNIFMYHLTWYSSCHNSRRNIIWTWKIYLEKFVRNRKNFYFCTKRWGLFFQHDCPLLWERSALPILLQKHFALCGTITGSYIHQGK
jgi:hypothetical protein